MTLERAADFYRRGLSEGWKTPTDVMRALHDSGAPLERVAAALRMVRWPDGKTRWPA